MKRQIYLSAAVLTCTIYNLFWGAQSIYAQKSSGNNEAVRIIMVVGANDGGQERQTLRYAASDANEFLEIFLEIGGVTPENSVVAINPDKSNFISSLRKFDHKVSFARKRYKRVEAIFYYSGHSDEQGILLGNKRISYRKIKKTIDALEADVRIAIFDSCSSGAFTQTKGGKKRSPFMTDTSHDMKGYAFMTSSSSDEFSQESETIKGSFFTYYLIAGLRGAADVTLDKKITLNEVYQYAYNNTLSRTQTTMAGPQHPNYSIQMVGTGDVILTDIRKSAAILNFSKYITGRLSIRNQYGILIGEFHKPYGSPMEFGIDTGKYDITYETDGKISQMQVKLKRGDKVKITQNSFQAISPEKTTLRGNVSEETTKLPSLAGHGTPIIRMLSYENYPGLLIGGKGGIMLTDNFLIGGEGYGLVAPRTGLGYGGFLIEYFFFPKEIVDLSLALLLGAGNAPGTYTAGTAFPESHVFWIAEPQLNAYIHLVKGFKIGLGVSYRLPLAMRESSSSVDAFQGVSGGMFFMIAF